MAVRMERLPRIVLALPRKTPHQPGFLCLPSGTKPGTKPFSFPRQKWLKPWSVSIGQKNREIESTSLLRRVRCELGRPRTQRAASRARVGSAQ